MEEAQAGGLIDKYWIFNWMIMPIFTLGLSIGIGYLVLSTVVGFEGFKNNCESFGGEFYIMENTSCTFNHQNCIYRCNLHDKSYSLDDFTTSLGFILGSSKQMCIDDCAFHNREAGENICVC